jgi:hypothetical protein|tara:strand:+ start:327 stop:611 length:285 start_codon:yes stop_codon:yes gene_type:complete
MDQKQFDTNKALLEYLEFLRNSFRIWMQSTTTVQNLGEMILTSAIEQSEEGYNEWRKILNNWVEDCKKSSQYFQNTIERDLKEMEEFLSSRKKQ